MIIPFTPKSAEKDIEGVLDIIKHLADGQLFDKRLSELRGVHAQAEQRVKDAQALGEKYANADKLIKEATEKLSGHADRANDLAKREDVVLARESAIAKAEHEHKARLATIDMDREAREKAVAAREKDAADKHAKLNHREAVLNEREVKIEAREKRMREISRSFDE